MSAMKQIATEIDEMKELKETVTTFELKCHAHRASTGLIEHSIEESVKALIGADARVVVVQLNDTTLSVTIRL